MGACEDKGVKESLSLTSSILIAPLILPGLQLPLGTEAPHGVRCSRSPM